MSFMMADYKKSYGRLSPVLQRSLLQEYQTRRRSKCDKKEDEVMVCMERGCLQHQLQTTSCHPSLLIPR